MSRPRGRTSAREVAGISNFTERGLTRPTRGGEKLGQPPCVTSLPAAKIDADVGHQRKLSFLVHPFKRGYLGAPPHDRGFRHITFADYQARPAEYVTQSPSRHIPSGIRRPFPRYGRRICRVRYRPRKIKMRTNLDIRLFDVL